MTLEERKNEYINLKKQLLAIKEYLDAEGDNDSPKDNTLVLAREEFIEGLKNITSEIDSAELIRSKEIFSDNYTNNENLNNLTRTLKR